LLQNAINRLLYQKKRREQLLLHCILHQKSACVQDPVRSSEVNSMLEDALLLLPDGYTALPATDQSMSGWERKIQ